MASLTIAQENQLPGTPESVWDINGAGDPSIQGFATDISVNQGQTVSFKINDTARAAYHIDIYRTGYYQGNGARLITTIPSSQTQAIAQPNPKTDATTGLVDAGNWTVDASWVVPSDATSGVYFADLVRNDTGGMSQIVFVVRNDASHSDILFQTSDTTWQAYNTWGGPSLYQNGSLGLPSGGGVKVSYNRPLIIDQSSDGYNDYNSFWHGEYPMVRWLEANGYDVSYFTDVDSDRNGALIKNHQVFMSVGHDEYWSDQQRANVTAARDAGVSLAFFSGNESFWKVRWENSIDGSGTPYRTLVCYKESKNGPIDPLDKSPTWTWTGTWRDPNGGSPDDGDRPENAMSGTLYMNDRTSNDLGVSMTVPAADANLRFWRNTSVASLAPGQVATLGQYVVGYEVDEDLDNGFRPAGLIDMSSTTFSSSSHVVDSSGTVVGPGTGNHQITLYRAPSGALVFGAGTVQWSWGLDGHHNNTTTTPDPAMQQATVNLLADMRVQPATLQPGLVSATTSTDAALPTSMITSPSSGATFEANTPVTITGTATDAGGGVVAGVEVSTDGGQTWHPATGRASWSYNWTPSTTGPVVIKSRATDDSGNIEIPSTGVSITISPSTTTSLWNATATPKVASDPDSNSVELGVKFRSDVAGSITGIRFYKGSGNTGTHVGHLWTLSGTLLATATFINETATGWQQVSFASPVAIAANTTYVASYFAPAGHYAGDSGYFATSGVTNGTLHALADGVDGGDGVYVYGTGTAFPTNSFQSANYWVDVAFSTTAPADTTPPTVTGETPAPGATGVATGTAVAATFSEAVQPSTVALVLKDPSNSTVATGPVSYNSTTNTATWTPSAALAANTTYTATVSGAKDTAGNVMAAPVTWSFTTATATSGPINLFGNTTPANPSTSDSGAVEVGVKIRSDVAGSITGIRFYKGSGNTGTHVGHLWSSTGTLLATVTFSGETATGWQQVSFASPVAIAANTTYVASYYAPKGHYASNSGYFATSGVTNGTLHALANGVDGGDGVYVYGTGGKFPTSSFNSTNYWVDVVFTTTAPSGAAQSITAAAPLTMAAAPSTTAAAPSTSSPSGVAPTPSQQPSKTVQTVQASSLSGSVLATAGNQSQSPVLYLGRAATWQNVVWNAGLPPGVSLVVQIRSGNSLTPDKSWSEWTAVDNGGAVPRPHDRYLQYSVSLASSSGNLPRMPISFDISITSVANSPIHQPSPIDRASSSPGSVLQGKPFVSSVYDAGPTATWKVLSWTGDLPPGASLVVEVSSGDTPTPSRTWSPWTVVGNGEAFSISIPSGRYLRYRVRLLTADLILMPVPFNISLTSSTSKEAASPIQQANPPQDNLDP